MVCVEQDCIARIDMQPCIVEGGSNVAQFNQFQQALVGQIKTDWANGPGVSAEVATWFGEQKVAAFGVETRSSGVRMVSNKAVHRICGEMGYTHYENLINLHQLVGLGRFQFIGLPLNIRGGTGSPVRAVAVIE